MAGDQVPVIPFCEVVGRVGIFAPLQKGPTAAKVGVTLGETVIVTVAEPGHPETVDETK
jgi:hypothetical protein